MKANYPLLSLAIEAFGIGTTEFSSVGLLPVIAKDVDVSIPAVGMLVSAYAVDVMVGAPLMTLLLSHCARRDASIFLTMIFTLGNMLLAISPDYTVLILSRILTSPNHGTSFSLGSVVAVSVVPKYKQVNVVAAMFMGLTIANIGGVPAMTWPDETIDWRMSFTATARLGVIAIVSLFFSLSKGGAGECPDVRSELAVLMRLQVPLVLLTTVLGAGAMSTLYAYISPVLHAFAHTTPAFIAGMLVLIGIGFLVGNYSGDKLADHSVNGTLKSSLLLLVVIMLIVSFLACSGLRTTASMVVWDVATLAIVPPLQIHVIRIASGAPGLSPSANISTSNLGNALGAAAGGAVISDDLGYSFVPIMGATVVGLALLLVFVSARRQSEEAFTTAN